jgi:putative membrane protein
VATIAWTTPGSGAWGFSLLESLNPSSGAGRPWRYGGRAAISGRRRTLALIGSAAVTDSTVPLRRNGLVCHDLRRPVCQSWAMRFIVKVIVVAFAMWLTTLIVAGVNVVPYEDTTLAAVLTYLLVGLIFGLVNAFVGTFVRIIAFPLYVLTLGLISFIVNGLLLLLVAWISSLMGFGLVIDGFWWGVLGAIVLGLISWLIGLIVRPSRD